LSLQRKVHARKVLKMCWGAELTADTKSLRDTAGATVRQVRAAFLVIGC
jgi:hypothetical protein